MGDPSLPSQVEVEVADMGHTEHGCFDECTMGAYHAPTGLAKTTLLKIPVGITPEPCPLSAGAGAGASATPCVLKISGDNAEMSLVGVGSLLLRLLS